MTIFRRILSGTIIFLACANSAAAQTFSGIHQSNYAGVYGILYNPASAASTRYKWDLNIAGADAKAGNTYMTITKKALLHRYDTITRNVDYFLDTAANRRQNGWEMAEIMMPSIMYSIDEKQTVSFIWRIRSSSNGGNIPTEQANFFGNSFPNRAYLNTNYTVQHAAASSNVWHEFGLSYARIIANTYGGVWKGGVTVKYLSGIAAGYASVDNATFRMNTTRNASVSSGTMRYGYSDNLDHWDKPYINNFKPNGNSGFSADLGVIYEYRPDNDGFGDYEGDHWNPAADFYQWRIGASITDIGSIGYNKAPGNTDLDLTTESIDPYSITYKKNQSLRQFARQLNNAFTPIASDSVFRMALPATLHLMADYNIDGRFYVSANADIALNGGPNNIYKTYGMTQVQVTPRYDVDLFGAYMPIIVNKNGMADVGAGFRIGPLIVGSNTLFTNLFRKTVNRADAYVALRWVPIKRSDPNGGGIFHMRKRQLRCPVNNN
ncbi:hypothetical protein SAMN05444266_11062 [Chitinophaga jiangningensis]|uniref:DUF5723 domain-containing protein n=1 Tax=Chitinophaga jiangningensis TaxID=1419482 RepID=A0A1M7KYE0_9BACT|nr:DUF5723 family protein [Chitinophaga jiangningensis]SHM70684.1 hypothetical protein SAMN05444266_11062 [Chitinophaga jiangningensis]